MKPRFFRSPEEFRSWLVEHHATSTEILVGFHKVATGKPSMTWPQSVDEALAFGWIDGVRRRIDEDRYSIRFTPRKSRSIWSAINIKRVKQLIDEGRMAPAGLAAFERRDESRSEVYSYERKSASLDEAALVALQKDAEAWSFFSRQPAWYRRTAAHWVASAKRPETSARRLETLIACSKKGERIPPLAYS